MSRNSKDYGTSPDDEIDYLTVLDWLHTLLQPRTYLEIGTQRGHSLKQARCASLAIDPQFALDADVVQSKPMCMFFQQSSDRFFEGHDPVGLFREKVDIAFLDGMHLFEYLLRDFINVERCMRKNSVIVVHDVLPTNLRMAERIPRLGDAWTGDVWRTALMLKRNRPDISITALDAKPTGLLLCTNLNPSSTVLSENYQSLVREYSEIDLEMFGIDTYRKEMNFEYPSGLNKIENLSLKFWI